ncbi:MAG: hypothetical protein AAFP90_00355, partial [Planctomycetota bacterium]
MPKCSLTIQLDSADGTPNVCGGKISGRVIVDVSDDVKCNGLVVRSTWKTHGRGNVTSETVDTVTVFTGNWTGGSRPEYPFTVKVADWPPTYHGRYLSVDHAIEVQAKIPWAFDPKAEMAFPAIADGRRGEQPAFARAASGGASKMVGIIAAVIGAMVFGGVVIGFALNAPFLLLFVLPVVLIIFGVWFFFSVLPTWVVGKPTMQLSADHFHPGQTIEGSLIIDPSKSFQHEGISVTLHCYEQCVSGSGSNRKTHRHTLQEEKFPLVAAGMRSGGEGPIAFSIPLPKQPVYSLKLGDNEIKWELEAEIEIPKWPDWSKKESLSIVPSQDDPALLASANTSTSANAVSQAGTTAAPVGQPNAGGISFDETIGHLAGVQDDPQQAAMLVDAVAGIPMQIHAIIEQRLLYSKGEPLNPYSDGYVVLADHPDIHVSMKLYVPHDLADEMEQADDLWQGRGAILGWDEDNRRVLVHVF